MKITKTLTTFLFAIVILTNANAQTKEPDIKAELFNLLKSKHDYEKVAMLLSEEDAEPNKDIYIKTYSKIKENKDKVLSYIDTAITVDRDTLSKKVTWYKYKNPMSSSFDPENRISYLTYFKIVKYSLENQKNIFPPLSEIPFDTAYESNR